MQRLLLPALFLALVLPASSHATFPGGNGELAATYRQHDRGGQLVALESIPFVGSGAAEITSCTRQEGGGDAEGRCPANPSYSPDGSKLAFDADGRLVVVNADGTGMTVLPPLTEHDSDPDWSPAGDRLIFTGKRGGRRNLFTTDPDGRGSVQLTVRGGRAAAWSTRGSIAFVRGRVIYRLDIGPLRRRKLARGDHPSWSPSGLSVVYERRGRAYAVRASRRSARRLLRRNAGRPVLSPDGRRLAFVREAPSNPEGLSVYVARVSGGGARLLREGGETPVGSTFRSYGSIAWRALP